jgi:ribosome recycling factor
MPHEMAMLECEEGMDKAVAHLIKSFRTVRTGRATPALVENLKVEAYGSEMPLKQCGNISVPEARMLVVKPFDAGVIGAIEKALLASDLGVTPQSDGKLVRLQFPALNEDRRKQLATQIKNNGEEAKVSIRNARRDGNKDLDKLQKDKSITEDDCKRLKEDINDLTKKHEKTVDSEVSKKTEEIMEI